jgi:hypothetical protein
MLKSNLEEVERMKDYEFFLYFLSQMQLNNRVNAPQVMGMTCWSIYCGYVICPLRT